MPSVYAHFRLGKDLFPRLTGEIRSAAEAFPQLYRIGLHGPDLLFYYRPLRKNPINRLGSALHKISGRTFFSRTAQLLRSTDREGESLAYTAGLLCHFAMDATCHRYICSRVRPEGPTHFQMETDLERALLEADGFSPQRHRLTEHLPAALPFAEVIAPFYEGVDAEIIRQSIRTMHRCSGLLQAPGRLRRAATVGVLEAAGGDLKHLVMRSDPDPMCRETTRELLALYRPSLAASETAIHSFMEHLRQEKPLEGLFFRTFDGEDRTNGEETQR